MRIIEIISEALDRPTKTVDELAKKHGVSIEQINAQLEIGMKVEGEHTTNKKQAKEIALDHLDEDPKYYTKLKKANL